MNALTSPLGRLAAPSPLTSAEWKALEHRLWREFGKVLVGTGDRDLRPDQRSVIEEIGKERFGER